MIGLAAVGLVSGYFLFRRKHESLPNLPELQQGLGSIEDRGPGWINADPILGLAWWSPIDVNQDGVIAPSSLEMGEAVLVDEWCWLRPNRQGFYNYPELEEAWALALEQNHPVQVRRVRT